MNARRRAAAAGAISLAGLLAVGAPLIAQGPPDTTPGKKTPPAAGKAKAKSAPKNATLFATLLGRNEIGPDGKRRAGDLDGQGGATVVTTGTQLCFAVAVRGIDAPAAMHVHRGRPNVNGPVVVPLTPPASGDPGTSAGCANADGALLREITKHPIRFYVNVHTGDYPDGALRGQLHRAPRWR
jgi:CHRD domain